MKQRDVFEDLTRNAFDFLERAIDDFGRAPKYSVIHFCAAVEMLLKARLMKEHWSLIVSKPEEACLAKFMIGDFTSINLEEARSRIRDIACDDIGSDAYASFRELANHRNKIVHFFHPKMDSDNKAKAQIVSDHCRSWFHLHRLLTRWDSYFRDFADKIARVDRAMQAHRKYLSAKFKALRRELDSARKAGNAPRACSACGFMAAVPAELDRHIASLDCLVCEHVETQVQLDCPHCSEPVVMANEGFASCAHCRKQIEPEHLADALTDHAAAHIAIVDGADHWEPANCGECDGYHTVIQRGDHYFCTSCFEIFDRIEHCGWCNELSTGDMEQSNFTGCGHCDGRAGWEKDD